jgi:anti-sigma regulatory factor (Ser/Thr protein kinase)
MEGLMAVETLDFRVEEASQTAEARRAAAQMARELGHDATATERVAIVVTELCTNLLKHAGGGRLLVRDGSENDSETVEVLAIDKGPGMADIPACFRDGYTTAKTPGTGLGAVVRLSNNVDVYSVAGQGTALLARIAGTSNGPAPRVAAVPSLQCSGVRVRKPGQDICGDNWTVTSHDSRHTIVVADGLGHGPDAAKASTEATHIAEKYGTLRPKELVDLIHAGLRSTRGAAVAVSQIDVDRGTIAFAGAGNIAASVVSSDRVQHLVSVNGTAGQEVRRLHEYAYPWLKDSLLLMHSDGLGTRWNLASYPGLVARDPALVTAVLYRDHSRQTDDTTIVAVRTNPTDTQ